MYLKVYVAAGSTFPLSGEGCLAQPGFPETMTSELKPEEQMTGSGVLG